MIFMCKIFDALFKKQRSHKDDIIKEESVQVETDREMILLERFSYSPTGTFGILTYGDFKCFSVERAWKNNERFVSCIPDGEYKCSWYNSPRFGRTLAVIGGTVSLFPSPRHQRSAILFHLGNWPHNFEGCIGLGREYTCVSGQIGVTSSRDTVNQFLSLFEDKDNIDLVIRPTVGAI